ncbi:MAG: hemolysin III family protein [Anaerolineae bacterium]|nr:hemolysin III family protein [Anaerolineae bacterium]MDQ7035222.1 hemolysin III family protein [Anaerolineae bacterium]
MKSATKKNWLIALLSQFREPVNGLTHALGAILAFIGMIWLVWMARDMPAQALTLAIFGITMVLVYVASTVMHLYNGSEAILHRLNQLDHAAIYLLIAGTYTPFTYAFFAGWWRWGLLAAIWTLAIIGIIIKLGFNKMMDGHASTIFYVAMGWVAVIAIPRYIMLNQVGALWLILAGGILYTIGAVIFALRKPNFHKHFGHHEIWHLFVMGGSAFHFIAAALYVT